MELEHRRKLINAFGPNAAVEQNLITPRLVGRPEIRCDGHFGTLDVVIVAADGTEIVLPVTEARVSGFVGETVIANLTMCVGAIDLRDVNGTAITARGNGRVLYPNVNGRVLYPNVTIKRRMADKTPSSLTRGFAYYVCAEGLARTTLFPLKKLSVRRRWRAWLRRSLGW